MGTVSIPFIAAGLVGRTEGGSWELLPVGQLALEVPASLVVLSAVLEADLRFPEPGESALEAMNESSKEYLEKCAFKIERVVQIVHWSKCGKEVRRWGGEGRVECCNLWCLLVVAWCLLRRYLVCGDALNSVGCDSCERFVVRELLSGWSSELELMR